MGVYCGMGDMGMGVYTALWAYIPCYGRIYCSMGVYTAVWAYILRYGRMADRLADQFRLREIRFRERARPPLLSVWEYIPRYGRIYRGSEICNILFITIGNNRKCLSEPFINVEIVSLVALCPVKPVPPCGTGRKHHMVAKAGY